jgi:hypothetical protein
MHAAVRLAMILSLLAAAFALWRKDVLPSPTLLKPGLQEEPEQRAVRKPILDTSVNGIQYRIQPRYTYELHGLVVSMHDSDTWWDYAHREWGDHINVVDLCVIWGENVRRDSYKGIDYWNDQWTCWMQPRDQKSAEAFDPTALSNNHLVTDDPYIARMLRKVRVGDQVRFTGYLADYSIHKPDGTVWGPRVSSTVRTDTGNGACETVYVESFEILDSAGRKWRLLLKSALAAFVASLVAWTLLPVKFND